jgi:phospholipid transport system substrate-binding protein
MMIDMDKGTSTMRTKNLLRPPVVCAILSLVLALAAPAGAAVQGPKATLQRVNGNVDRLLRKKTEPGSAEETQIKGEVKRLAAELLDYAELAKRSLGEQWDPLTAKQRAEFVDTFKELIERNYVRQLRTNLEYEVTYGDEKMDGEEARVTTTIKIQTKGKPTQALIEYRMIKRDTRWMVYDVVTDELSLVRNYRSQFTKIIRDQGYNGLMQKMKSKLAEKQG